MSNNKITNIVSTGKGQSKIFYKDGQSELTMNSMNTTNSLTHTKVSNGPKRQLSEEFITEAKSNGTIAIGGTGQLNTGGFHLDVGSQELHSGIPQKEANAFNVKLHSFILNPPDNSNDNTPKPFQLPSIGDMLNEMSNFCPDCSGKGIPPAGSIGNMADLQRWAIQFAAWFGEQLSFLDLEKQKAAIEARIEEGTQKNKIAQEDLEKIYGSTLTKVLYGPQLLNPLNPVTLNKADKKTEFIRTKSQLFDAADLSGGRNKALSKLG